MSPLSVFGGIDAKEVPANEPHQSHALLEEGQLHDGRSLRCLLALPAIGLERERVVTVSLVVVQGKGGDDERRACRNSALPEGRLPLARGDLDEPCRWREYAEVFLHDLRAVDEVSQHGPRERLTPDDAGHLSKYRLPDVRVGSDVIQQHRDGHGGAAGPVARKISVLPLTTEQARSC